MFWYFPSSLYLFIHFTRKRKCLSVDILFKEFPFISVGNVNKENPVKLRYVKAITHPSAFPGYVRNLYTLTQNTKNEQ